MSTMENEFNDRDVEKGAPENAEPVLLGSSTKISDSASGMEKFQKVVQSRVCNIANRILNFFGLLFTENFSNAFIKVTLRTALQSSAFFAILSLVFILGVTFYDIDYFGWMLVASARGLLLALGVSALSCLSLEIPSSAIPMFSNAYLVISPFGCLHALLILFHKIKKSYFDDENAAAMSPNYSPSTPSPAPAPALSPYPEFLTVELPGVQCLLALTILTTLTCGAWHRLSMAPHMERILLLLTSLSLYTTHYWLGGFSDVALTFFCTVPLLIITRMWFLEGQLPGTNIEVDVSLINSIPVIIAGSTLVMFYETGLGYGLFVYLWWWVGCWVGYIWMWQEIRNKYGLGNWAGLFMTGTVILLGLVGLGIHNDENWVHWAIIGAILVLLFLQCGVASSSWGKDREELQGIFLLVDIFMFQILLLASVFGDIRHVNVIIG